MVNIFQQATRAKLRFPSIKGAASVSTEDLWDLPLTSKTNVSLDQVARECNKALKEAAEESFVATEANDANSLLRLRMDVVKAVIEVRLAENKDKQERETKAAQKETILQLIAQKKNEKLSTLSVEELEQMLK